MFSTLAGQILLEMIASFTTSFYGRLPLWLHHKIPLKKKLIYIPSSKHSNCKGMKTHNHPATILDVT
jgi:hypothetical protein